MIFFAADLTRWFNQHGIDSSKVTVVLRCDDEMTRSCIDVANRRSLEPLAYKTRTGMPAYSFKLHGVSFVLTTLDRSAKV